MKSTKRRREQYRGIEMYVCSNEARSEFFEVDNVWCEDHDLAILLALCLKYNVSSGDMGAIQKLMNMEKLK
jgi:hypothetical protein